MLNWNVAKVKRLTGTQVWLFIIARVLIGFGLGVMAVRYFPQVANLLGIPALVVGAILVLIAGKGLFRPTREAAD